MKLTKSSKSSRLATSTNSTQSLQLAPAFCQLDANGQDQRYHRIRRQSLNLCEPLQPEDFGVQAMPDVSPPKWHLAHTTWFFEKFVLLQQAGWQPFDETFLFLFNSYYKTVGAFQPRPCRGILSRPSIDRVLDYRTAVDGEISSRLQKGSFTKEQLMIIEVGLHHEQQHQELLLTDIKYNLFQHPFHPIYREDKSADPAAIQEPQQRAGDVLCPASQDRWLKIPEGLNPIGFGAENEEQGFCYDNERQSHEIFLSAGSLSPTHVTNGEFLEFVEDKGYETVDLWLSSGWDTLQNQGWQAPLYWVKRDGMWWEYTLTGLMPIALSSPVSHVSYFEADAYARWRQRRLPTEAEWEAVARDHPTVGTMQDDDFLQPQLQTKPTLFGDVWDWTSSSYGPYPGFRPLAGALGEYNGKFMCNQYVLRGGSSLTPADHIRPSYRNFLPPEARWQCSGIRLAEDS